MPEHIRPEVAASAAGLFDNVLSDYLWARAVLLIGENSPLYLPQSLGAVPHS